MITKIDIKQTKMFFAIAVITLTNKEINSQGCVAIKRMAGVCSRSADAKGWELNII